jgi:hypothetical protein
MTTSSAPPRPGLLALAAAGVLDLVQLVSVLTVDDAPPIVAILTAVFGAVTLAGVALAWRGSRAGLITAIAARIADFLVLGVPAFFLDAPWWAIALVLACLVLSIAGIWLSAPALRRVRATVA